MKEEQIKKELEKLLDALDMDWGILTCGKKHAGIHSVHLSDLENAEFTGKLHAKFWDGCPAFPGNRVLSIIDEK